MSIQNYISIASFSAFAALTGLTGLPSVNAIESSLMPISATDQTSNTVNENAATEGEINSLEEPDQLAQFFPYASTDEQVVMVQGLGTATAPAETAAIEFVLVNYDPYYDPYACTYDDWSNTSTDSTTEPALPEECSPPPDPVPLTRASLKDIVDALTTAGIASDEISVRLPGDESDSYAAYYYVESASVLLTLEQPSRQQVQELVTAVEEAVSGSETVYLQDRYVQYTLSEAGCNALETEAYRSAVVDARDRATVLAEALGVAVGNIPSVADSAYSPFSINSLTTTYPSYCDADLYNSAYGYYNSPSYYDSALPAEVRVQRSVYVTYPVGGR